MTLQILVVEAEQNISQFLQENTEYDVSKQEDLKLLSMDQSDILIVHNEIVDISEMINKKDYLSDYKYVFYVGYVSKQDAVLAKTYGIVPIETNEPKHVHSVLETLIHSEKNDRVFAFVAADRKAGNTSIIHSVAENLVSITSKSVLVISLNNNLSEPNYAKSTLDQLKTSIVSQNVSFEEILSVSTFNGKYAYIGANQTILDFGKYNAEQISHFYTVLLEQHSHLILLDLGSDAQNPFHVVAFDYVQHMFLITKPSLHYSYTFTKKVEQIYNPYYKKTHKDFYTIINGSGYVSKKANNPYKLIAIIETSDFGLEAENSNIPLHKLDATFNNETQPISKYIATLNGHYTGVEEIENQRTLKYWVNTLRKKVNLRMEGSVNGSIQSRSTLEQPKIKQPK